MSETRFEGLNLVELIDLLHPVPEPPAISMWPETAGWMWIGGLTLALCAFMAFRSWQRYQKNAFRRMAMAELLAGGDDPAVVADVLRRVALVTYPRCDIVSLHGDAWLHFLDESLGKPVFLNDMGRAMLAAPFRPTNSPVPGLNALAQKWVRQHRAGPLS